MSILERPKRQKTTPDEINAEEESVIEDSVEETAEVNSDVEETESETAEVNSDVEETESETAAEATECPTAEEIARYQKFAEADRLYLAGDKVAAAQIYQELKEPWTKKIS